MITFADEQHYLRPSSLLKLVNCPASAVMALGFLDDDGGAPAQTGSFFHALADAGHCGVTPDLVQLRRLYPDADEGKAAKWYASYVADAKNKNIVVESELPVTLTLAPDASDPTGSSIFIKGTLDQLRTGVVSNTLEVWDIKTGSRHQPREMHAEAHIQQAAYVLAARQTTGLDVRPGGIIRVVAYETKIATRHLRYDDTTLSETPMTVALCTELLSQIPPIVAAIRRGERRFTPSADHCKYCPFKPYPNCRRHS